MMKKFIAVVIVIVFALLAGVCYFYRQNIPCGYVEGEDAVAIFKDLNPRQLSAAKKYGITPVKNRKEARKITDKLVCIESNDLYKVDRLTHSIPYLTNGAEELLKQIAQNFQDSLRSRKCFRHRIIVTSVLRTEDDVDRLRKSGNKNASKNSAHMYATTFDITYARYDRMFSVKDIVGRRPSGKEMKAILADVLKDLRLQQKCYVKYETGQQCFHITSRIQ